MYFDITKLDPVNNYYIFTVEDLIKLKKTINRDNLKQFENDMHSLFSFPLESVVSKENLPPSKDIHDYVSLATYYWPNPDTDDGLPYVQQDGLANPTGTKYDKDKLRRLAYLVYHAGLLYLLTDDQKYYQLLKDHCVNWFINKETRMNPNLNYGQYIPGVVDGRAEGIIDYSANFSYALHMITILSKMNRIDIQFLDELKAWHREFKQWLITSEIGKNEKIAKNNHGTFYDFALLVINLFLNDLECLENDASLFLQDRINAQIMNDGSLPKEIARTKSKSYTFMGLKGMLDYAELVNEYGVNLLDTKIKCGVDWLYKLTIIKCDWPYEQITPFDEGIYIQFINQITKLYGPIYLDVSHLNLSNILNKVPYYLFVK